VRGTCLKPAEPRAVVEPVAGIAAHAVARTVVGFHRLTGSRVQGQHPSGISLPRCLSKALCDRFRKRLTHARARPCLHSSTVRLKGPRLGPLPNAVAAVLLVLFALLARPPRRKARRVCGDPEVRCGRVGGAGACLLFLLFANGAQDAHTM
jgi:hypothetical protein